jgi:hypothetical protein
LAGAVLVALRVLTREYLVQIQCLTLLPRLAEAEERLVRQGLAE